MHPVNRFLHKFGLELSRIDRHSEPYTDHERSFRKDYDRYYKIVERNQRGFRTRKAYRYEVGNHPFGVRDLEFEFAAYHLYNSKIKTILDIGSPRSFLLGLLAHYNVTSVDIRYRRSFLENENVITGNAKDLKFNDNSFDSVLSLEALPHFGLCRYDDDFDLDADIKAFKEMVRVLKPGGLLIFSTAMTGTHPFIAFNARRNYSHEMIRDFCSSLKCIEERFINRRKNTFCSVDELTTDPDYFDYYTGCWQKHQKIK